MFREIRVSEKITDTCVEEHDDKFMQIKPETDMSFEDAKNFWNNIFG